MEKEESTTEMDARLSIKLPTDLLEKVREKSAQTGISISFIVRKVLEDWVNA